MLDDEHYMDKWAEAENDTSSRQHRSFIRLVYLFLLGWEFQVEFPGGSVQTNLLLGL